MKSDLNNQFSVNLYLHDEKDKAVYPWFISREEKKHHMYLLIFSPSPEEDAFHCALIHNFDQFLRPKSATCRLYFCKRCLCRFYSADARTAHTQNCGDRKADRVVSICSGQFNMHRINVKLFLSSFIIY